MAKYKILRPVEHNRKLYVPATAPSTGDGSEIEVDASGSIDLSDAEASQLTHGQIQPLPEATAPGDEPGRASSRKTSVRTQTPAPGEDHN